MRQKKFNSMLSILLTIVFLFTPSTALADTNNDKDKNYKVTYKNEGVSVNKTWTIKLNRELDSSTINSTNIYIEDWNDTKVSTTLSLSKNNREITIKPNANYVQGKQYHIILKDIKAKNGKKLVKHNKIYFNVKNLYAGLPAEDGLIILGDTAYSIDYLANNARLKNEILNGDYDVYYCYGPTLEKIKNIFGDIDISGSNNLTQHDKITYIGPDGERKVYGWNSETSEYELIAPSVNAEVTVNSTAKVIMVKVTAVEGVDGAEYFKVEHSNSVKKIGETVVFSSANSTENIEILSSNKAVLATGNLYTLHYNKGKNKLRLTNGNIEGNTVGNLNNNGYVTEDSYGYLYFNNTDDKNKLYKLDTNGVFNNAIADDNAQYINVFNGWVYYSNYTEGGKIYKVKEDGTSKQKLCDDMAAYVNVSGDWIYYSNHSDGGRLYKIKSNGTGRAPVSQALKDEVAYINVSGGWIYYTNKSDRHRPYVINKDGSYVSKLSDEWADSIQVSGDWIYYTSSSGVLSKVKKDGTGTVIPIMGQTREFDKGFHLNVVGNWVYYSNYKDGGKLYKISVDGSGTKHKLTNETVEYINIVEDSIFYTSKGKLYKLPIDTDGTIKGELVKKSGSDNKIIQMDDLKITVPYYDVNLTLREIEDKYLPDKVPGIKDDNTMHQFSVCWDREKVTIRNGIRIYTGDVIGFNRTVKLELEIPSEMLNETNTITIYNNPDQNADVIEVKNLYDNNLYANPPKLNPGDVLNAYDSEECTKSLSKATVVREGKYNKAVLQRLELDEVGQKSVWITVTRNGKSESRPTEVKQADMPVILTVKDKDDFGFGVDGRDVTIEEWLPSLKARLSAYYIYLLPNKRKLDLSQTSQVKAIKGYGDVDAQDTIYGVDSNLSHFVTTSNAGLAWTGDRIMVKDSSLTQLKKGKYDIFIAGRYNSTAAPDNRGKCPSVIGYISSDPATVDMVEEILPNKPTLVKSRVKGGVNVTLPKPLNSGESAWLVPVSTINSITNWKVQDGFSISQLDKSNADNANGLRPECLYYDGVTNIIKAPKGMAPASPEYKDIEFKLVIVNKVGASVASDYSLVVDNLAPKVSFVGAYKSIFLGDNVVARSTEDGKIYLMLKADSANSPDQLEDAVKANKARSVTVRNGIGYGLNTTGLEGNIKIDPDANLYTNYKVVAVDEAGNISEITTDEELVVWVSLVDLDRLITEANDASLSPALDADKKPELVNSIFSAKSVRDKVAQQAGGFTSITQKEINTAFDTLKYKMMMLGIASRYASIDEILRAEQNALQDMVIKEDTDIPFKSRFITNDANVTVEIDWQLESESRDGDYIEIADQKIKIKEQPVAKDRDIALKATITVTKDGATKSATKRVVVTVMHEEFSATTITADKGNESDGISTVTIEWNPLSVPPDHYEIVASTNGTPKLTDKVATSSIENGKAVFDYETTSTGRILYVAVVAVDEDGNKAMCKNVMTVNLPGETK